MFKTLELFSLSVLKQNVEYQAGILNMVVRIVNREDPDQSGLGLNCLSRTF